MTAATDHWVRLDGTDDYESDDYDTRSICSCGWRSDWYPNPAEATDAGRTHAKRPSSS